jgi:hypothetical protein
LRREIGTSSAASGRKIIGSRVSGMRPAVGVGAGVGVGVDFGVGVAFGGGVPL